MTYLALDRLAQAPLDPDPYPHVLLREFVPPEHRAAISASFPKVPGAGSHPPSALRLEGPFAALMAELTSLAFRQAVEQKFAIDLAGRPQTYTVRGFLDAKDGAIHRDSDTKLVTVLLYLNDNWNAEGGRLRLLRSATDMEDYTAEVPPDFGTLLIFLPAKNTWHGHKPFAGPRRTIQTNWVTDASVARREMTRHHVSTTIKKITHLVKAH
jgi:hypothetical protein